MLPVISDFLFDDPEQSLRELALLNATHDVFIVLVDSAFAFRMPPISSGWIETVDVETGRVQTMSRSALADGRGSVRDCQDAVRRMAKDLDLDVVRIGLEQSAVGHRAERVRGRAAVAEDV